MKTNEFKTNRKFWKQVVAHRKEVFLDDNFECFNDYIVLNDDDEDLFGAELSGEVKENLNNKEAPDDIVEPTSPSLMARQ